MKYLNILFCENLSLQQGWDLFKSLLQIFRIVIPIILIVMMIIDAIKTLSNKEVDLKSMFKKYSGRIIAALLIFFLPTFISLIINMVGSGESLECFNDVMKSGVMTASVTDAKTYVNKVEKSYDLADYEIALERVNNLDNSTYKNKLLKRLQDSEEIVMLKNDVMSIKAGNTSLTTTKQLEDRINYMQDGYLKKELLKRVESVKNDTNAYNILPIENLKQLSGNNIADKIKKNGSSISDLNQKIKNAVIKEGKNTREAAVAAAATLINTLGSYGYLINYEWWGKYEAIGVDERWGTILSDSQYKRDCNDFADRYNNNGSRCWNEFKWYGLDCSGFVKWIVIQASQNTSTSYFGGVKHSFSSKTNYAQCQIGDPVYKSGHVAMIVGLDDLNKQYNIAESSPPGVKFNTIKYTNSEWWCNHISIYSN